MVRIRTDGEYGHREDTIEDAMRAWGVDSKTEAILLSCELSAEVLDDLEDVLTDDRLPPGVAADLAERLDRSRYLEVEYDEPEASVSPD